MSGHNAPQHQRSRITGGISPGILGAPSGGIYDGLVAYWSMDEVTDTGMIRDGTGRGNDIRCSSNNVGKIGRGFSTTSSYLWIADNSDLSIGSGQTLTISLWANPTSTAAMTFIGKDAATTNRSYRIGYSYTSGDRVVYAYVFNNNSSQAEVHSSAALALNSWNFVLYCWDGTNKILSVSVNNGTDASVSYTGGVANCTSNFEIGRLQEINGQYLSGGIDEVCVWKRVLTPDERALLYNGGNGTNLRS